MADDREATSTLLKSLAPLDGLKRDNLQEQKVQCALD